MGFEQATVLVTGGTSGIGREVAAETGYLAGEAARPVTGTALAVDAGRVAAL
ncbi:MAG: hypothetical protein ACRDNS_12575 [Trebonia sp.]